MTQKDINIYSVKSWWKGPRWAGVSTFIKNLAWELDLECEVEVDKGWFCESGRFKVTGNSEKLELFKKYYDNSMDNYNKEV